MRVHVLVEGPSEADWIPTWAARAVRRHHVKMHPHQGKPMLLEQLVAKLETFGSSEYSRRSDRVLLLVDRDNDRCVELDKRLRAMLARVSPAPIAEMRVAVVETEAFFLGDPVAIRAAWPDANLRLLKGTIPDEEWTSELFMRVIGVSRPNKRAWARAIAPHLGVSIGGPNANRSPSFRAFASALLDLCNEPLPTPKRAPPKRVGVKRGDRT